MTRDHAAVAGQIVTLYCTSPLMRVDRPHMDVTIPISAGTGADRENIEISDHRLVDCLMDFSTPAPLDTLVHEIACKLGISPDDSSKIIDSLITARVLVTADEVHSLQVAGTAWERYGWRDAFDFHFAVYGLEWERTNKEEYEEAMRGLYDDVDRVGPQPSSGIDLPGDQVQLADYTREITAPFIQALERALPMNVFTEFGIDITDVASLLSAAYGVQMTRDLVLGEHLLKASPSGGARHPIEVYLAAREVTGLEAGVYHYNPKSNSLTRVRGKESVHDFDATCFDKGGIKTSSAILFLTCRQLRHAWKYRYPRSYRMILMELGHNFQTTRVAAAGLGLDVYYNPAIDDARVGSLLKLPPDCEESPMLSIGLGRGGTV
jgi:SagB-type dehydrogenase family enzyme